jgi:ankyrin repeat protein
MSWTIWHPTPNISIRYRRMIISTQRGMKDAAALLIAKGADLTLRNRRGQTPIETAIAFGHYDVAEVMRSAIALSK